MRFLLIVIASTVISVYGKRVLESDRIPNRITEDYIHNLNDFRNLQSNSNDASDFLVASIPGLEGEFKTKSHSGFIEIDSQNKGNIFYWHFESEVNPDTSPLLIWLNGGPGCSSMDGLFLENGPFKIDSSGKVYLSNSSWHKVTNVLFVDQPVGTGLSYVEQSAFAKSSSDVASQFYTFLQKWLSRHSNYVKNSNTGVKSTREVYFFGESFAGRYIPMFVDHIIKKNKENKGQNVHINVDGVGIGNGWVHPLIQYDYSDYAHGIGLITHGQRVKLKEDFHACKSTIEKSNFHSGYCTINMDKILDAASTSSGYKINYYDVRKYLRNPSTDFPPGRTDIEKYLNRDDVRKAIHATSSHKYTECSDGVYNALVHEDGLSTLPEVSRMLESGVRVLFYNGQWDMMCNHVSTEEMLLTVNWSKSHEYRSSDKYVWSVPSINVPGGFAKEGGGLTYIVVSSSGHMVPMDVPEAGLDLARRFVKKQSYNDQKQPIGVLEVNSTRGTTSLCTTTSNNGPSKQLSSSTWLWLCFLTAIASCVISSVVTIVCMRSPARSREHCVIVEMDEQDYDDDEEEVDLNDADEEDEAPLAKNAV